MKKHQFSPFIWRDAQRGKLILTTYQAEKPITWKEASRMLRAMQRKPSIERIHGKAVLTANFYGRHEIVMSMSHFIHVTPHRFWQRLFVIDATRAWEIHSIRFEA